MKSTATSAQRTWSAHALFVAGTFGVFSGYVAGLAMMLGRRSWILAASGKPVPCDFLAYWASGLDALSGHAASAYDPNAQHAVQVFAAGPSPNYYYWNYPPLFFFVAALLASAPYLVAFLGWVISTGATYAVTIGAIARRWEGILGACASPVVLLTAFGGQNGFLTAAVLGGVLLFLPTRPVISGILLGLMTYKPQFGILLPIALICGGHWRTLCSATITAIFAVGISAWVFGAGAYLSFYRSLPVVAHAYLTLGGEGWGKMQSSYAIARLLGGGDLSAWVAQAAAIGICVLAMAWLWHKEEAYELKAAGLAAAVMLSTPYVHIYDFPVFVVALAFLYRHRPFDRLEWCGVVAINLLMLTFLAQTTPIGPGIAVLIGALILRRVFRYAESPAAEWVPATS